MKAAHLLAAVSILMEKATAILPGEKNARVKRNTFGITRFPLGIIKAALQAANPCQFNLVMPVKISL